MIGTHGNVILMTEAGKAPLTSMEVKTERGVYTLNIEHKEFSPISGMIEITTLQLWELLRLIIADIKVCFVVFMRAINDAAMVAAANTPMVRMKYLRATNPAF